MSELKIPCRQPWSSATTINPRDMVKITVGKNDRIREYEVHADVLKEQSGYFHNKPYLKLGILPDLNEDGVKVKRTPVQFPDELPVVFDAFVNFLYMGDCTVSMLRRGGDSFLFLCKLSTFAVAFEAPIFRNTIVNVFISKVNRTAPAIPYDIAGYLQEHGRDTALRDMLIDIIMSCGEKEVVVDWRISLGKGFFKSVYVEGGVVPFRRSRDVKGYLDLLRRQVCEHYHEHPEGVEVVEGDEPLFIFDPPLE